VAQKCFSNFQKSALRKQLPTGLKLAQPGRPGTCLPDCPTRPHLHLNGNHLKRGRGQKNGGGDPNCDMIIITTCREKAGAPHAGSARRTYTQAQPHFKGHLHSPTFLPDPTGNDTNATN
jgi:hypothetical protein